MAVFFYQTQDGQADYGFSIEYEHKEGWRIYIVFESPRRGNDGNPQFPYQATAEDGRSYVDWPPTLDHLGDAKEVAAFWAEIGEHHQAA
ncbi:MAG: hypothetical protein ABIZ05_18275 [Pseudonocardiaceae bacterium]